MGVVGGGRWVVGCGRGRLGMEGGWGPRNAHVWTCWLWPSASFVTCVSLPLFLSPSPLSSPPSSCPSSALPSSPCGSEYTVVARSAQSVVTLLPGVPMRDVLEHDSYDYYVFSVDQSTEVTLVLTPLSGDPDMYDQEWGRGWDEVWGWAEMEEGGLGWEQGWEGLGGGGVQEQGRDEAGQGRR
jgi:hypothetical protein